MIGIWAFRSVLFFLLVLFTQPQMRFPILIPLHLGDMCILGALAFHFIHTASTGKPMIRLGLITKMTLLLLSLALLTHFFNPHQMSTEWNTEIDGILKVSIVLILLEAQIDSVYKASAVLGTLALGALWWVKGGLRLAEANATLTDDRLMGVNVTLIQNPNFFSYMMVLMIPLYFYFYRLYAHRMQRWVFVGLMGGAVFIALRTGSRTGLICLIPICTLMAIVAIREHRELIVMGIVGVTLMLGAVGSQNLERFRTLPATIGKVFSKENRSFSEEELNKRDELSAVSRWTKARDTFWMIVQYPLLGVGTNPKAYVYEGLSRARGKVHNEVLMAGRQMGFPGMLIYLAWLFIPIKYGRRVQRACKDSWPQVAQLGWTVKIMAIGILAGGMFSPSAFHYPHMLICVCIVSVWKLLVDEGLVAEGT